LCVNNAYTDELIAQTSELMDRYGLVHDSGTPEEYADLFTTDGEIATSAGGPAIVKGREALIAQARRDHERFTTEPGPGGKLTSTGAVVSSSTDQFNGAVASAWIARAG
jgi:hypothetical protein